MENNTALNAESLISLIQEILEEELILQKDSPLIGGDSIIDSMGLIQICLALEERSLQDNFEFDWTSEKAMSSLNSIFKTPGTLAEEYNRQYTETRK